MSAVGWVAERESVQAARAVVIVFSRKRRRRSNRVLLSILITASSGGDAGQLDGSWPQRIDRCLAVGTRRARYSRELGSASSSASARVIFAPSTLTRVNYQSSVWYL